jgi:DNA polymerase-3 subunit beta
MKVICNRGALLEALTVTGTVVSTRTPKPVLLCVKLTAAEDRLTLAATDLEVAIRFSDPQVQVEEPGETLVNAASLRDIIRESGDDTISLQLQGDQIHVKGHDSHFKLFTQNPTEFPPVRDFEGEPTFEVAAGTLKQLIGQTLFAVAKEGTRYAFNGVMMFCKKNRVTAVATDGRRLALATGDALKSSKPESPRVIVPAKALGMVDKLLTDPEESVGVQVHENQIVFHTANATLTANLVEGQFPPFEEVIPKECDKKMTAGTADLLSKVRQAALLTNEESKGVRMTFNKNGLILSSRNPASGEATINFAAKFEGADVEIGFNPAYLIDALRVVDTDEITFELTVPNRPGLLKAGPNFLYVIMPVNLQ